MFSPTKLAHNAEAASVSEALAGRGSIMEPKLDGIRLLAIIGEDSVELYTRSGKSQKGKLPHIEAELSGLPAGTVIDGEAVAFVESPAGKRIQDWGKAQSVMGSSVKRAASLSDAITYVAFDLLAFNGVDIRLLPLSKRRDALEQVITNSDYVEIIERIDPTEANYDRLVENGFEGAMVKRIDSRYSSGARGHGWFKLKATDEVDVVVMGFQDGQDGFSNMVGAIIFGQYRDGQLVERGKCSGMTMKLRRDMTANPDNYIGTAISIAHMGVMESGKFRHPQFKRLRDDKPTNECTWS
jgi:ATP-dependent DNA ligase